MSASQFVADAHESMTALCDRYGISRKTDYKWCARYAADDHAGAPEIRDRGVCEGVAGRAAEALYEPV